MLTISIARKPVAEVNVAQNVTQWGSGAINIDACRVIGIMSLPGSSNIQPTASNVYGNTINATATRRAMEYIRNTPHGRWPPNLFLEHRDGCQRFEGLVAERVRMWVCIPGCPSASLDEQSGVSGYGKLVVGVQRAPRVGRAQYGDMQHTHVGIDHYGDKGGVSRFFPQFKASER